MDIGGEPAGELPPAESPEMAAVSADEFAATDAASGGDEELGRERR
jgi:hypothetical protein